MGKLVVGKEQGIAIDLGKRDVYGASGFRLNIALEGEGAVVTNADMQEIIVPVDENSCLADGDTKKGSDRVKVKDKDDDNKVANFKAGDVVKVKDTNNYFYIAKVDADNGYLYPRFELEFDIADGAELERVGNTGIYQYTKFKPEKPGRYLIVIDNPSIGLFNKAKIVEVVKHNEDDIYNKLENIELKISKLSVDGDIIVW